ncbi:archaellin/type IV pilin N-terminal domain-containing protein [Methanolobus bombayensis]|uniref:archaellin/type IV pilin N-terminal domain-containing protein n=1 Tax=Methanolobus bombayensis TaxID=38023 RepID=UPI001AE722BE|nr:archaellin/type IV pilin N-terminal domain-containing protein [Methanolobus bombayensis]MBP1910242.1 flagellin FlaB [Methanolobus bombayensis]
MISNASLKRNNTAQVGIGTLIIFIAMVLIAAVAASVLIQTSGTLQQQAQSTGKQATQEVSSNLVVKNIEGVRAKTSSTSMASNISLLKVKVGLNVGSSPVDLNQLIISITDGTNTNDLIYANNDKTYGNAMANFSSSETAATNLLYLLNGTQSSPGANGMYFFTVQKIRDEDVSFSQANPIMNTGDLVTIYISVVSDGDLSYTTIDGVTTGGTQKDSNLDLAPRSTVTIVMTPEAGATSMAEFVTPSSYGTRETIQLYP